MIDRDRAYRDGMWWTQALRGGRAMTAYFACDAAMRREGRRCANRRDHMHPWRSWSRAEARGAGAKRFMPDGTPCWCVSTDEPHEGWQHSPVCTQYRYGWPPPETGTWSW